MSFIDDDRDEKRKRNQTQWRDPENPVSERQIQNWQMRRQQAPAQKTPEEQILSEMARRLQPDMEAAGFTNPFAYVAHLGARRSSDPREARMQEMFRREVAPGAAAVNKREVNSRQDEGSSFAQARNDSRDATGAYKQAQASPIVGSNESTGKGGIAPTTEPPELYGGPRGPRRVSPLSATEREGLIDRVLVREGGAALNSDSRDPGNAGGNTTKLGIIQKTLDAYRSQNPRANLPARTSDLSEEQARQIYDEMFIQATRVDEIADSRIREYVFDSVVNHPYRDAVVMLQSALRDGLGKDVSIDGVLGSKTLETINRMSAAEREIFEQWLLSKRIDFVEKNVDRSHKRGVRNRVVRLFERYDP